MQFKAEIKEVKQSKRHLDAIYSVKFETDNPLIMDLGKLPAQTVVDVEVGLEEA